MISSPGVVELSVVVPVHRESLGAAQLLAAISAELALVTTSYEIVVIDDGSPDDTWEQLVSSTRAIPQLRAVRLSRNFGKESAIAAGLERAAGQAVIVMDGDFQHPPELIPALVAAWRGGEGDVVEAVKVDRGGESLTRRLAARAFYRLMRTLSGVDLAGQSDFKLLDRRVVTAWLRLRERNLFFRGLIPWLGFRHRSVSFAVRARRDGESQHSLLALARLAVTAVSAFSSGLLHLVTFAGVLFFGSAIVLGTYTLALWASGGAVTGFTTVILLLLIIGSLLMLSLGVIGLYLARIYDEIKARPRYLVAETATEGATVRESCQRTAVDATRAPAASGEDSAS